jgi:integrase
MSEPKLLDRMRAVLRTRHYSIRTEDAYVQWARRFILFHGRKQPSAMGAPEINAFLSHFAVERAVSASTQMQALCGILFLYRDVLREEMPWLTELERVARRRPVPLVLTRREVARLRGEMSGTPQLVARLLYGTGMRSSVPERDTRNRTTMLAKILCVALRHHLEGVRALHDRDLAEGFGARGCRKS